MNRSRPSRHGVILGEALATLADAGASPDVPTRCRGCAFTAGSYANACAGTVSAALSCLTSDDVFRCHLGLVDGEPVRPCGGYEAALRVTIEQGLPVLEAAGRRLDACSGPDEVQAEADAWLARVDPDGRLDDYERARLWERRRSAADVAGASAVSSPDRNDDPRSGGDSDARRPRA